VGSGDGKVKKLVGSGTKWMLEAEVQLDGAVMSLSVDHLNKELLAGTSAGKIYRIFPSDLSATLHTEGHTSAINDLSLLKGNNEIFATITKKGKLLLGLC